MQAIDSHNKLFASNNFEYVEINKTPQNEPDRVNFKRKIKSSLTLLYELENSFKKTNKYEDKLIKCRMSHKHTHSNDFWNTDDSTTKDTKNSNTDTFKSPRWSTLSVVCLQYQYEELSKRYNALFQAYNDVYASLSSYDNELLKLRKRLRNSHEELNNANKTILILGSKFFTIKQRKLFQKLYYKDKLDRLERAILTVLETAERARLVLNEKP